MTRITVTKLLTISILVMILASCGTMSGTSQTEEASVWNMPLQERDGMFIGQGKTPDPNSTPTPKPTEFVYQSSKDNVNKGCDGSDSPACKAAAIASQINTNIEGNINDLIEMGYLQETDMEALREKYGLTEKDGRTSIVSHASISSSSSASSSSVSEKTGCEAASDPAACYVDQFSTRDTRYKPFYSPNSVIHKIMEDSIGATAGLSEYHGECENAENPVACYVGKSAEKQEYGYADNSIDAYQSTPEVSNGECARGVYTSYCHDGIIIANGKLDFSLFGCYDDVNPCDTVVKAYRRECYRQVRKCK